MPHFVVGNTFPRLAVEAVARMCPLVSEAARDVGPVCDVQFLIDSDDTVTHARRQQLV